MNDAELTILLKEMLVAFNREARLVSPKLEGEMCQTLDKVGGRWLLAGLRAQGISGVDEVEQSGDNLRKLLGSEEGQKWLHEAITGDKAGVKEMRRRIVGVIRGLVSESPGMALKTEPLHGDGGIYQMLLSKRGVQGGKDEDSVQHNQG